MIIRIKSDPKENYYSFASHWFERMLYKTQVFIEIQINQIIDKYYLTIHEFSFKV